MNKQKIETLENEEGAFFKVKSYSIDEIMAAGGPDAFAEKLGKNFNNVENRLKNLPNDAFLTEEEIEMAIKDLREHK